MKKKTVRKNRVHSGLTKHGKYLCLAFLKFITVLSVITLIVLGSYTMSNNSQVLGVSTSIYQKQCSFWDIFCSIQSFFHFSFNQSSNTNSANSLNQQTTQDTQVSSSTDPTKLTLGDGKYTPSPQKGYIYTCQTTFTGGGAQTDGNWIHGTTWDSTEKISVQGSISWPNAQFSITTSGNERVIKGNGLPVGYTTGIFPISSKDPAYQIDRNPNSIKTQTYSFSLPLNPQMGSAPQCIHGIVGVAVDGVPIFDGLDAGGRDAVAHEVQDSCNGHPQEQGQYHYHGPSRCMKETTQNNTLVGYALDGYGIYSMYGANGKEYTNADLDECHGLTSEVLWNGKMQNVYHYVETREYPYSVGCFKGSIVVSEQQMGMSMNTQNGSMMRSRTGSSQTQGGYMMPNATGMPYPPRGMTQPQGGTGFPPPPGGGMHPY